MYTKFLYKNLKERDHCVNVIILKWMLKDKGGGYSLEYSSVAGFHEYVNYQPSGSVTDEDFPLYRVEQGM
jgi:hypothetical protein